MNARIAEALAACDARDARELRTGALELAANGWAVFPCRWQGEQAKAPLTVNGHKDASTDVEQIRRWWDRWPQALIGAPVPERLLVVDVDPRNGGSLAALGALPDTLRAWSGRNDGGVHLYFLRPPYETTAAKLPSGIDLKVNGYCIVPPSRHPATGEPYRWEMRPPVPLPPSLAETLKRQPPPARAVSSEFGDKTGSGLLATIAKYPTQGVNNALYWAARKAAQDGILDDLADDMVNLAVQLGESHRQAVATVDSARRKETA